MRLYVMRHGPAEDHAPSGRDRDRRLTADGRRAVERSAREILRLRGSSITRIVASPYARAQETARIVATILGPVELGIETEEALVPHDEPELAPVRGIVAAGQDALLVGHQPSVEVVIHRLVDDVSEAARALSRGFRTAMVVELVAVGEALRIDRVVDPTRLPLG